MSGFDLLTIIVLASTERLTLRTTIDLLLKNCRSEDIKEIIIFLISSDCPSAETAEKICKDPSFPVPVRCAVQKTPGLSNAVYEIPRLVESSHFLIIASDLEMDPLAVPAMIETSREHPDAIVCASKFKEGSKRENYGRVHYLCNRVVNAAVERILDIKGTELISTFQIYPLWLFKEMDFNNPKRTFYEFTIRPLSAGKEYIEIPTKYKKRTEGASNFNPWRYIKLGVNFISTALHERKRLRRSKS